MFGNNVGFPYSYDFCLRRAFAGWIACGYGIEIAVLDSGDVAAGFLILI